MPLKKRFHYRSFVFAAAGLVAGAFYSVVAHGAEGSTPDVPPVGYNATIRGILTENCFACHGPDAEARAADLRLDEREAAIDFGAIVPGDAHASALIDRINLPDDDDMAMPPIDGHKRLTQKQKDHLRHWIAQGAKYEAHWSLQPTVDHASPTVSDPGWVRGPIDAFILRQLDEAELKPAAEADRRTLARRLSLDLTGLPPTPEAVEQFVDDPSPEYYEKYVDQLLQSPAWGEHRGRYWLDYARYGDTHGIHFDNYREMWSYRDWVINAFNQNQPFDQFSIEQLAGDLLPDPSLDQLIATGFNRCNITTNEGGIIDEEYKVLYARDRTETTSAVWLGLTTGCAVCHDHKFDPITTKDFYALSAFFDNTTQPVRDQNIPNTPPIVPVPQQQERQLYASVIEQLPAAVDTLNESRRAARERFDSGQSPINADEMFRQIPHDSMVSHWPLSAGAGPAVTEITDGVLTQRIAASDLAWQPGHISPFSLEIQDTTVTSPDAGHFNAGQPFSVSVWVRLPAGNSNGAILSRMDEKNQYHGWDLWLQNNQFGMHLIEAWPDDAIKLVVENDPLPQEQWVHVAATYDGSRSVEGLKFYVDGKLRQTKVEQGELKGDFSSDVPFHLGRRHGGSPTKGIRLSDVRLYDASLSADQCRQIHDLTPAAYAAALPPEKRTDAQSDSLFERWTQTNAPEYQSQVKLTRDLQQQKTDMEARGTIAHVMNEAATPATAFILHRGEYDQRGEQVTADTPEVLPAMNADLPRNRLGLAQWFFDPENPLTARVTVNRFWQEIFGQGLVSTTGDFGVTGTQPTHPQLLDRLAIDFRDSGWDVQELFRQIVTSSTYRQAATATAEKIESDPSNQWLCRGKRFRMDAEMVRDYALAASDLLSPEIGGASVRPYQPPGVWEAVAMPGSNTRNYTTDTGAGVYRRSMYTFWKRSAPPASMDILNAPSRETCVVRRDRTNTPLQALVTLNGPQFIEAARHLAAVAIKSHDDTVERVDFITLRLLARTLEPAERAIVEDSLQRLRDDYANTPEAAAKVVHIGHSPTDDSIEATELAAWTMLCNQLMNLDEVLNQ